MFRTLLSIVLLLSVSVAIQAQQPVNVLTRAEVDALLARPADVLVIDVRRPDEIGSIGGFPVYLNVQIGDLETRLPSIPRERVIVTVSNHSTRSVRAAELLQKNGFKVASAAGAQDYEAEGGALVKIAAPARSATATEPRKP